jgi:hypothetical protein
LARLSPAAELANFLKWHYAGEAAYNGGELHSSEVSVIESGLWSLAVNFFSGHGPPEPAPPPGRRQASGIDLGWLLHRLLTVAPPLLVALYLIMWGRWIIGGPGLLDRSGVLIGGDFSYYWIAARLAWAGEPASVYDAARLQMWHQEFFGVGTHLIWSYPPTFLLLLLPVALGLGLASLWVFGPVTWQVFLESLHRALQIVGHGNVGVGGTLPLSKMTSVFAALRLAGAGTAAALVGQGVVSLAAAAAVVWIGARQASVAARNAALVLGVLLFTPYEFGYDLTLLALPLAWRRARVA